MSEPIHDDIAVAELPRLRIHHFFVLTTVFAVVMSVWLGIWRLVSALHPDAVMPEFSTGISLIVIVQWFSQSTCVAVTLLGLAWRKRGLSFPGLPGHWMALYLAIAWLYEIVLSFISIFTVQAFGFESMAWVTMPITLVFHCLAVVLWIVAYLYGPARLWKLGWAAMALKSLLLVLWDLFHIGVKCVDCLLDVFQYASQFDWDFFFLLGPYERIIAKGFLILLSTYALILFLPVATFIDLRQHRRLHWSHWLVLISTFVFTAVVTVYMHFAF